MKKGKLYVFEGPEGCGKDTQISLFEYTLKAKRIKYKSLREPGTTELGKKCREYLLHDKRFNLNPIQESVLFNAARTALILEEIEPTLNSGTDIILNRYFHSTLAYQIKAHFIAEKENPSYKSPISQQEGELVKKITMGTVKNHLPDLTFIFDVPVETGLARVGKSKDKFESREEIYHEALRKAYLEIAEEVPNCVVINGKDSIEEIHENVLEKYLEYTS